MNSKIAHVIKGKIEGLSWIDKIAGLVQTVSIRKAIGETFTVKTYPVSCDVDYDACVKGRFQDLTPDSKKKSVIYFEDRGCTMIERQGQNIKFQSNLRLVCWLNLKEIHGATCNDEIEHCQTSWYYVLDILKELPTMPFKTTDFLSVFIASVSEVPRTVEIFSKYSYNQESTQYLLWPFDFFSLDFQINVTICIPT
jgi:hypothetical protein